MMKEVWKDIVGYEGIYQVSNKGRIRSLDRYILHSNGFKYFYKGLILKPKTDKDGYLRVTLNNRMNRKMVAVHRIVASVFLDNPNNYPVVHHKNEKKDDNKVCNLEWCTVKTNNEHSKAKIWKFKSPDGEIMEIFNLKQFCRENPIDQSAMGKVHAGKQRSHNGWTKA